MEAVIKIRAEDLEPATPAHSSSQNDLQIAIAKQRGERQDNGEAGGEKGSIKLVENYTVTDNGKREKFKSLKNFGGSTNTV